MSLREPVSRVVAAGDDIAPWFPIEVKRDPFSRLLRLMRRLFGKPPLRNSFDVALEEGRLTIGRYSYGRPLVHLYPGDTARVTIGSFCSIAEGVEILPGGQHRPDWVSTFPFRSRLGMAGAYTDGAPRPGGSVVVGNDVWIGRGAKLLSGADIGDGAVIGAYAVVAGTVRPYAIAVGNPAREVRLRFPDDQIARLLEIRWWDWPIETIREHIPRLCSDDIDGFVSQFLSSS